MRRTINLLSAAALIGAGATLAGCAGAVIPISVAATAGMAAAQEGVAVYSRGKIKAARFQSIERLHAAILRAFEDLDFEVIESRLSRTSSFIQAQDRKGTRTTVKVAERSERVCSVGIRVGVVGDRFIALLVLETMDKWLSEFDAKRAAEAEAAAAGDP